MRLTFAAYIETSLDYALPGFFEEISHFEYGQRIDKGAFTVRKEFTRIEVENVREDQLPRIEMAVQAAAERLFWQQLPASAITSREDWVRNGRVTVAIVPDAPNPEWTHGMEGDNPAIKCPKCGSVMRRKQVIGKPPFWGCSRYPDCKGSRSISQ